MAKQKSMFLIVTSLIYIVTRLSSLTALPIFVDESLYLRMTLDLIHKGQIWVSFTDGKEPLFFWAQSLFVRLTPEPLFAGRIFAVLSGWILLLAGYKFVKEILDPKTAAYFVIFYLVSPFIFFYNRLAVIDGFLTTLLSLYLLFLVRLAKRPRLIFALVTGTFLSLALLTKTIAWLYIFTLPIAFFIFPKNTSSANKLITSFRWVTIVLITTLVVYLPIVFAPGYQDIWNKNQNVFVHPWREWLFNWTAILIPNLKMSFKDWWLVYFGVLPILAALMMSIYALIKKSSPLIFLTLLFVIPWFVQSAVAKLFFPRYLLFIALPVFALCSYFLIRHGRIFLLLFLAQPLFLFATLLFGPESAPIPEIERWQYFTGWPSGYGTGRLVEFLGSQQKSVTVVTEDFGIGETLKQTFYQNKNVTVKAFHSFDENVSGDYLVLNFFQNPPSKWSVREIESFCRVQCKSEIRLYEIRH